MKGRTNKEKTAVGAKIRKEINEWLRKRDGSEESTEDGVEKRKRRQKNINVKERKEVIERKNKQG